MSRCSRSWPVLILGLVLLTAAAPDLGSEKPFLNPDPLPAVAPPAEIQRTDLLTEGFESTTFPPTGWASLHLSTSYAWARTTGAAHTGVASAYVRYGPASITQNEWLVTPALDFSALSAPKLEFYEYSPYWSGYGEHHYIMVSTTSQTDPAQFTVLHDWTPVNHPINESSFGVDPTLVSLTAYAGQPVVYIAFRYVGSDADNWYIDDVRVFEPWAHDVKVTAVAPTGMQFASGGSFTPQVAVANVGLNTETFDLKVEIRESGTQVYSESVNVSDLPVDGQTTRAFPAFTVGDGHYYEVTATADLPTDLAPANNVKSVINDSYNVPKVPLGHMHTNWGCTPCVQANQALDAYYPGQGNNVAIMRVHCWWPSSTDPMYLANVAQSQPLIYYYGADYAPHMWVDGVVDAGSSGTNMVAQLEARKAVKGPLTLDLSWNATAQRLRVVIENINPIPPDADWRVKIAVTEDGVALQGPNGEPVHNHVFRYMYPDINGQVLPTSPGSHYLWVDCPLSGSWVYSRLRATVFVQDQTSRKIHGAATAFLTEITEDLTEVPEHAPQLVKLHDAYPNPFNPATKIRFNLPAAQSARLTIFGADGRRVATLIDGGLAAGDHEVVWSGRDEVGRAVASGAYFYRLETDRHSETKRMMLVK